MRVFLALASEQLPSSNIDKIVEQSGLTCPHLPADRHMTLMFLGEQSPQGISDIRLALNHLFTHKKMLSVSWQACLVGDFPSNKPKAWALQGVLSSDLNNWVKLMDKVIQDTLCKRHQRDAFVPHVTLSYIKQASGLELPLNMQLQFDQLVLCRSYSPQERAEQPQIEGWANARYEVLARWNLEKK